MLAAQPQGLEGLHILLAVAVALVLLVKLHKAIANPVMVALV
jgi:hypothetical protein